MILGYEDVNDHDKLRHDPALKIALEKLNELEDKKVTAHRNKKVLLKSTTNNIS